MVVGGQIGGGAGVAIGGILGLTVSLGVCAIKFYESGHSEIIKKIENWTECD